MKTMTKKVLYEFVFICVMCGVLILLVAALAAAFGFVALCWNQAAFALHRAPDELWRLVTSIAVTLTVTLYIFKLLK